MYMKISTVGYNANSWIANAVLLRKVDKVGICEGRIPENTLGKDNEKDINLNDSSCAKQKLTTVYYILSCF